MPAKFYAGRRLSYSGTLCTVRYSGPVQGTKGDWLGVEWDDANKGKHFGEHDGVKYFECLSKEPTAGSFVRPTRPFDRPLGFLETLHMKYASDGDASTSTKSESSNSQRSIEISGKVVEEVGFDKIRRQLANLQELHIVLLDGLCLAGLEANPWRRDQEHNYWLQRTKQITEVCPKIVELDLSRNLIEEWVDIVGICKALPMLRSLKLNGNRFKDLSTSDYGDSELREVFDGIQELYLNDTLMTWEDITSLTAPFSTLKTLSLSSNRLSNIPSNLSTTNLTTLSLSQNALTALSSLEPLTHLPDLEVLSLRSNKITTIAPPGTVPPIFPSLHTLDLSHNAIPSFSFISHLPHTLPALTSLRTSENPFTTTLSIEEAYILVLARIPTLTSLNYSKITPAERTNAELYYLSSIGKQLSSLPLEDEPAILSSQHPCYADLCALHGSPTITRSSTTSSVNTNTLEARLIDFTFYLPAHELVERHLIPGIQRSNPQNPSLTPSTDSDESWEQVSRIPRTVTPYRLKALVGDLFDLPPMYLRLIWETGEWDPVGGKLAGDDDARWSVSSEDEGSEGGNEDPENDGAGRRKGKWVRREVELVDGTREVGFWIEDRMARVRVEVRGRTY